MQKDEEEVEEGPRDTIPPLQAKATPHNDETDDVIIVQAAGEKEEEEESEETTRYGTVSPPPSTVSKFYSRARNLNHLFPILLF